MTISKIHPIESKLSSFAEFIEALTDVYDLAPTDNAHVTELRIELPVELELYVSSNGNVDVDAGPPTQLIETSFMPVWHHMLIKLTAEHEKT